VAGASGRLIQHAIHDIACHLFACVQTDARRIGPLIDVHCRDQPDLFESLPKPRRTRGAASVLDDELDLGHDKILRAPTHVAAFAPGSTPARDDVPVALDDAPRTRLPSAEYWRQPTGVKRANADRVPSRVNATNTAH
jgi:hypothetical protein